MLNQETGFILIVDDNSTNLSVLSQALKSAGYKIRAAMDGESAITQVERQQPDLILLDVQMPGIDGFETCRRLKANPTTQHVPIIFTTALADVDSKLKGLSLGAVDYITKPFEQDEVLARVKIHLQLKILNETLEQRVLERTNELNKALLRHEINNPISSIAANIPLAKEYTTNLKDILYMYQQEHSQPSMQIRQALKDIDIEFIIEDFWKLLNSIESSSKRIEDISVSLRTFSRGDDIKVLFNLHEGLNSTLMILQHRLKAVGQKPMVEVVKKYGDLPLIKCYPGQINQVLMNLLANAIDALEEAWEKDGRLPTIYIQTEVSNNSAIVRIIDNGLGMTEDVQKRLFEPLYTTKAIGKGTGLGLSISLQIIEEKHTGKLSCCSTLGKGTEFLIEIPVF
jgi:signal transduction histidine kinase